MSSERTSASVDGRTISYRRSGSPTNAALVVLHGIGGNADQWRHQLDALSDAFDVVAWDAPGYGDSDDPPDSWTMTDFARSLAGLLDHLGIASAHIVGQSWGGVLAQELYREYGDRFLSLTLSDTYGAGTQPAAQRDASLQARLHALETMTPAEMAVARAPAVLGLDPSSELLAEVEGMLAAIHPAGYRVAAIALAYADARDVVPRIAVPTLVITGEHDAIVPPSAGAWLQSQIPGACLISIAGAGHLAGQERPEEYNAALRRFLEQLSSPE